MKLYPDGGMFPKTEFSLKGRIFSISLCYLSRRTQEYGPLMIIVKDSYKIPFVTVTTLKVFNFLNTDLHIQNEEKNKFKKLFKKSKDNQLIPCSNYIEKHCLTYMILY